MNFKGFAIQKSRVSYKEEMSVIHYAIMNKIPYKFCKRIDDCPLYYIPVGSVEWCEKFISSEKTTPNYYPEFLKHYLFRKVWKAESWPKEKVFIKPADRFKKFTGFVINEDSKKRRGKFWCSEVVNFLNEWRYYIANGKVIAAEWYNGNNEDLVAPTINLELPLDYCAALDFGVLDNGNVALVEAHLPYACGWYGKYSDFRVYAEWLISGWNYLERI